MLDTRARKFADPLFERFARLLLKLRFTPNVVTLLAFLFGLGAGVLLYFRLPIPAVLVLWFSGLLDAVDGAMARQSGKSSLFGAVLDVTGDAAKTGKRVGNQLCLAAPSRRDDAARLRGQEVDFELSHGSSLAKPRESAQNRLLHISAGAR